jgi:hypothetical protein
MLRMGWLLRSVGLALLSFTLPPNLQIPTEDPLPRGVSSIPNTAPYDGYIWISKTTTVSASRVRLNGLGAKTHANWVLFRLPFDSRQRDRVRSVHFEPHASVDTHVGALLFGSVCTSIPPYGDVSDWSLYTVSGIGRTLRYAWHIAPPTTDPTIVGINVPTRVANYAACGRDDGRLHELDTWTLDISWEER